MPCMWCPGWISWAANRPSLPHRTAFFPTCPKLFSDNLPALSGGGVWWATPWDKKRVLKYIYAVSNVQAGPDRRKRAKGPKHQLVDAEVRKTYDDLRQTASLSSISRTGLQNDTLQQLAQQIVTAINNNIKEHFFSRQYRYILSHERDLVDFESIVFKPSLLKGILISFTIVKMP